MIILMNNIYENSNNLEKNVIASFVKDPYSVLFKNIKNKLDFKFIIEKDIMNNITEELNELFEINKVFLHESKYGRFHGRRLCRLVLANRLKCNFVSLRNRETPPHVHH